MVESSTSSWQTMKREKTLVTTGVQDPRIDLDRNPMGWGCWMIWDSLIIPRKWPQASSFVLRIECRHQSLHGHLNFVPIVIFSEPRPAKEVNLLGKTNISMWETHGNPVFPSENQTFMVDLSQVFADLPSRVARGMGCKYCTIYMDKICKRKCQ